ncbi:unnamed protein product, partial [marine sediment metagenome]
MGQVRALLEEYKKHLLCQALLIAARDLFEIEDINKS